MNHHQILIVESELLIAKNLTYKLEKLGYHVVAIAHSGQTAIENALTTKPDLILMNIAIQGAMDTITTATTITKQLNIPIIYLTNYADEPILKQVETINCYGYINKPFQESELDTTIRIAISQYQQTEQIRQLAITDSLTGLLNRRQILELATTEFSRSRRYQKPFSVLLIDIDRFKLINDNYGHAIGDQAIKATAEAMVNNLRQVDYCARFGGEEFVALMPETSLESAMIVAERIRSAIASITLSISSPIIQFTASIGIASYHLQDQEFATILQRADLALYQAKLQGRNRIIVESKD